MTKDLQFQRRTTRRTTVARYASTSRSVFERNTQRWRVRTSRPTLTRSRITIRVRLWRKRATAAVPYWIWPRRTRTSARATSRVPSGSRTSAPAARCATSASGRATYTAAPCAIVPTLISATSVDTTSPRTRPTSSTFPVRSAQKSSHEKTIWSPTSRSYTVKRHRWAPITTPISGRKAPRTPLDCALRFLFLATPFMSD